MSYQININYGVITKGDNNKVENDPQKAIEEANRRAAERRYRQEQRRQAIQYEMSRQRRRYNDDHSDRSLGWY